MATLVEITYLEKRVWATSIPTCLLAWSVGVNVWRYQEFPGEKARQASVTRPDTPAHRIVGSLVVNRDVWGRLGRFATGVIGVMAALDLSLNVALHAREVVQAPEPSTSQQVIIQIYTQMRPGGRHQCWNRAHRTSLMPKSWKTRTRRRQSKGIQVHDRSCSRGGGRGSR